MRCSDRLSIRPSRSACRRLFYSSRKGPGSCDEYSVRLASGPSGRKDEQAGVVQADPANLPGYKPGKGAEEGFEGDAGVRMGNRSETLKNAGGGSESNAVS